MSGPTIWVYDIETTPNLVYAWGLWRQNISPNQIVKPQDLLCFAAHKLGTDEVEAHAAWDSYDAMIKRLHQIMDEADYLVGYNNAKFDDKHVRAAFARNQLPPPAPYRAIDLYRVVKKQFQFPSHRLDYVCRALGIDGKVENGGMETWAACLNGDREAQYRMLEYNRQDVRITAKLFERLLPWIDGLNVPLYSYSPYLDDYEPSCPRCGSTHIQSRGWAYTTGYRYRRYQCQNCKGWLRDRRSEPTPNAELRSV